MSTLRPPRSRDEFTVAIICALEREAENVRSVFDICWEDQDEQYGKSRGDTNAYSTGVIGRHNVVLAHMPGMGSTSASAVASGLKASFSGIQLALVVGICGVVPTHPNTKEEIFLGDVIISTAVVQYDFGRKYPGGFERKKEIEDSLGRASPEIRSFISMLRIRHNRQRLTRNLALLLQSEDFQAEVPAARYPSDIQDRLYRASYDHVHRLRTRCDQCHNHPGHCPKSCHELGCEEEQRITRSRNRFPKVGKVDSLPETAPAVHFGRFGSANTVMKSGCERDRVANADELVAFEMEGAGVWDLHPTVVIKAACDYADSHRNKEWQNYAAATAAACLKVFLKEWTGWDQLSNRDQPCKPPWHVRFDHIPGFVGRTKELNQLKKTIYDPTAHRVMSILGLGGLGKSRLALELAYQIYEEPPQHAVYWIQATDQQTLERDVRGIGKMLRIPGIEDPNADVKALVRQRLSDPAQHPWHWLLILDSADDEALWGTGPIESNSSLSEFLPLTTMTNGSILITTRTRRVANFLARREVIELNAVTPDEAADIFDYELNSSYLATNDSSTRELLEKLTYLPLAIVQAASFIRMTQQPVETYLDLLERPEPEVIQLLSEDFGDQTRYPDMKNPVATTWLISFHHIKQHHDLAAKFLSSMACYHEKSIPRSLLPQVDSENDFIKTLAVLTGYSFIRRQMIDPGQEELYDMHRLVHLAARNWLKMEGSLTEWTKICTKRTTRILWDFHHNYWDQDGYKARMWTIYLPHASYLYEYNNAQDQPEWYYLLEIMGYWLIQEGKYHAAVEALTAVAKWKVSKFGTSARETLWTYRDLGEALIRKGDWPAAERCFQQVASQSSMLGQKDVLTLVSRQGLASTYMKLGRWKEAEELQRQLVTTMKVVLGPEHDDTMGVIQDLAWTYSKQGRWKEAEELARQVLTTTKRVLKPEHPSTLTIIHNLAEIYSDQGRLEDVEELQRQLLTTRKRVLGVEHPDTLTSIDSLAFTLMRWGRLKEAEELQRQVLTTSKRALGVEHPHTLISMNNLHFTLMRWGRLKEAEELQRQVLTTSKRALGVVHPNTLTSMNNLALVLKWQGRSDDAMELAASCRELCLESLGPSHHTTQVVSQTLAAWQKATGFEGPQEGRGVSRMPGAWPG